MTLGPKADLNRARYVAALRGMTPEQRLSKAIELSDMTRDLLRLGICRRYPDASDAEIQRIFLERLERCRNRTF